MAFAAIICRCKILSLQKHVCNIFAATKANFAATTLFLKLQKNGRHFHGDKINSATTKLLPIFAATNIYSCRRTGSRRWRHRSFLQLQVLYEFCSCKNKMQSRFCRCRTAFVFAPAKIELLLRSARLQLKRICVYSCSGSGCTTANMHFAAIKFCGFNCRFVAVTAGDSPELPY